MSTGGPLLRVWAVAAKEFWSLVRQPQLLLLVVGGPVFIMIAFALSFQVQNQKPTAVVVVEPGSEGAGIFERYREQFTSRTRFRGTVGTVEEADRLIKTGQVDGAIVVPPNPSRRISDNEQAVITARYSAINPIFGLTVPNRARGLLFDLNDALVEEGIERQLGEIRSAREQIQDLDRQVELARDATGGLSADEARELTREVDSSLAALESTLEVAARAERNGDGEASETLEEVREAREAVDRVREAQEGGDGKALEERLAELDRELDDLKERLSGIPENVSPSVLANPFRLHLENLAPFQPEVAGFYAPGVLAVLIQHVAVGLASLAIVRERLSGAYEFFEVSPLGPGGLLAGKFITYLLLVVGVGAAVVATMVAFLDVPMNGGLFSLAAAIALLTVASLGLGLCVSALARSQLQAIQVAMLLLIASGFFSGFLFPLSEMGQPARGLSYLLPATYGISALQDVMIRGQEIPAFDAAILAAISAATLLAARFFAGRKGT